MAEIDNFSLEMRLKNTILGMVLGHQMGQWSERRWWKDHPAGESGEFIRENDLLNDHGLHFLIDDPPVITTPGWTPTCFVDMIPHLYALGMEYVKLEKGLTPENFRDFLLREREWLRPQGVGRSCLELMAEGVNPRIAGLFSASVISGCWVAWPPAIYNAGNEEDAYEDAVKLARTQNGGDVVILAGLLSAMISRALVPGAQWKDVRDTLLRFTKKRGSKLDGPINEALGIGRNSKDLKEWAEAIRSNEFTGKVSTFGSGLDWLSSFYSAISSLEFADCHPSSWTEFAGGNLMGCDTRFGAMIAFTIHAAIDGTASMPGIWKDKVENVRHKEITEWVDGAYRLIKIKSERECKNAKEILLQLDGEIEESKLYDKILAAMLAGAIGNVMGSPVEDRDYPWIEERYGVLDRILDPKRLESEDDSAMAVMWAETYIRCGGRIYPEDLAETFKEKMVRNNFYYDTQQAYDLMMKGLPPHACGHWNVVTGSGLMGCNPCGMYHAGNPGSAAVDALELAYHYQRGFDVHAPAILCAATAEALREGATVESVLNAAVKAAPDELQVCFNRLEKRDAKVHLEKALAAVEGCEDVLDARKVLYEDFLEYNGQDPWEVVTFTLAIFKSAKGDVWQSMIGGTNIGRDSDTISSQSAILSACMSGMKGVPKNLMSLFSSAALENYKALAKDMALLVKKRCERSLEISRELQIL